MNQLVPIAAHVPALIRAAGERAQTRFESMQGCGVRQAARRTGSFSLSDWKSG